MGIGAAVMSADGRYRYVLGREGWMADEKPKPLLYVMLNPSTADAVEDDQTIRRCTRFAQTFGHDRFYVVNLYALRATDPSVLAAAGYEDAVGEAGTHPGLPEHYHITDAWIHCLARAARRVICAWGAPCKPEPPNFAERAAHVYSIIEAAAEEGLGADIECLGITQQGHPRHPSRLSRDAAPVPYGGPS